MAIQRISGRRRRKRCWNRRRCCALRWLSESGWRYFSGRWSALKIVRSIAGVPIRFTSERLNHIVRRHPEMADQQDRILETVASPDYVQEGDTGTLIAVQSYPKTPLSQKSCAVVYRELKDGDGFVLTAYFTSHPAMWRGPYGSRESLRKKRCSSGLGI